MLNIRNYGNLKHEDRPEAPSALQSRLITRLACVKKNERLMKFLDILIYCGLVELLTIF